jgi:hypothetical protein
VNVFVGGVISGFLLSAAWRLAWRLRKIAQRRQGALPSNWPAIWLKYKHLAELGFSSIPLALINEKG